MADKANNPLSEKDLEGAALLCLHQAAFTDRDQFPQGSGDHRCRRLHASRKRFEKALKKMQAGEKSLLSLGLKAGDFNEPLCCVKKSSDLKLRLEEAQAFLKTHEESEKVESQV